MGQLWSINPDFVTFSSVNHGNARRDENVFAVGDITGDSMPDLLRVDASAATLTYYASPSNSTATTVSFGDSWLQFL